MATGKTKNGHRIKKFHVHGPVDIPYARTKKRGIKTFPYDKRKEFWEQNEGLEDKMGCYIFGIRAGLGTKPHYVGEAKEGFKQECFTPHKLEKYDDAMKSLKKGTPVMFFVYLKGKTGKRYIHQLEDFLIENARTRNPNVQNINGGKPPHWGIEGVLRSKSKKPSQHAKSFREMMGI